MALQEGTTTMDQSARSIWGTSNLPSPTDFKPGGTAIVAFSKTSSRIIKTGIDQLGRWTYMTLNAKGNKDILIISLYQCCKRPTNDVGKTAYIRNESTRQRSKKELLQGFEKTHL